MNKIAVLPQFRPLYQNYRYKICQSGRGSSKSVSIATALLWYASRCKMKILCVREYMNSIAESSMAQLIQVIEWSDTVDSWYITKAEIVHKITGSRFIFRGVKSSPASIKSFPDLDIIWIEEAESISKESLDIILPTLRKEGSQLFVSGNNKSRLNAISQYFIVNEPPKGTVVITNSYLDNPFCSKDFIEQAEHMKSTNKPLYDYVYGGQYLDMSKLVLVNNVKTYDTMPLRRPDDIVVIGCDIARNGDKTVIAVRIGRVVLPLLKYENMDLDKLIMELQGLIYKYSPNLVNVDSTGFGSFVPDGLKMANIKVNGINFACKARKEERYKNKRTELYGLINEFFEQGGVIPNDVDLIEELEASFYDYDNNNRYALIPKDEIKPVLGRSPDSSDAVGLCMHTNDGKMFSKPTLHTDAMLHTERKIIANANWRK